MNLEEKIISELTGEFKIEAYQRGYRWGKDEVEHLLEDIKEIPKGQKYCDEHIGLHPEENRSASARGYGSRWRRLSKAFLLAHPLCVECAREGRYVKATVVDHIVPHRGDPVLFWDRGNWQALCHRHHSIKTRTQDMRPEYHF